MDGNRVRSESRPEYKELKRRKALNSEHIPYQRPRRKGSSVYSDRRKNKQKQSADSSRARRRWRQLIISGIILVAVIGVKLTAPAALEPVRQQVLHLMRQETDFVAAFSAVGRAIGGEDSVKDALGDACVAVFGTQEMSDNGNNVYSAGSVPKEASLFQEVLGFSYAAPLNGSVTSGFGYRCHPITGERQFHYGIDIEASEGSPIQCFAEGTVGAVGESALLGNYVTIHHENGFSTLYGHCRQVNVSSGQKIHVSDTIAEVGSTGESTGPHLHFELCHEGLFLNPIYYV